MCPIFWIGKRNKAEHRRKSECVDRANMNGFQCEVFNSTHARGNHAHRS